MVYTVNGISEVFNLGNTFKLKVFSAQEQHSTASDIDEAVEEEMEERPAIEEEQAPNEEGNKELVAFPQSSSQEKNPQSSPAKTIVVPSTPTFPFK